LPDGDFCQFVYGLRHNAVGENPFLPVLALTAQPTGPLVRRIVDSGSDDLLTKPLSANQLRERITALINARKPFVVTSDYIGPTRRAESAREASTVPLIEVPNVLREKATGTGSPTGIQQAIEDAILEINIQKLERYAGQILYLAERIVPALLENNVDETVRKNIVRLDYVANDTRRRLVGTKYDHVSELCGALVKVAQSLRAVGNGRAPSVRDAKLLMPLASAIKTGFETGTAKTALEIVTSLSGE